MINIDADLIDADWPKHHEKLCTASRQEGPLHAVADAHRDQINVAVRYAFALARRRLPRDAQTLKDAAPAIATLREALMDVLPTALEKALVAGGQVGAKGLRTAEGPGHPFHGNQWTATTGVPKRMSEEDAATILQYVGPEFTSINDELRGGDPSERAREFATLVDKYAQPLPSGTAVYRGLPTEHVRDWKTGQTVEIKGLISTSTRVKDAAQWAGSDGTILEIQPQRGLALSEALNKFLPNGEDNEGHFFGGENEVLLPHGSKYDVVGERRHGAHRVIQLVEKLPRRLEAFRAAKRSLSFTFNVSNPRVGEWALKHSAKLVTDISNTTRDWIREAVAAAADGELSDRGLHDAILMAIGDDVRADTIARTESMRAVHAGQQEAWDQAVDAGLLTGREKRVWIVTEDDALCPICLALENQKASLQGVYPGGVVAPPAHPRCRCSEGLA